MDMTVEQTRVSLQNALDEGRSAQLRNRLGQFATPTQLARDVVRCGLKLLGSDISIRFLDPAFGTGSFYSALLEAKPALSTAAGFEIDSHYGAPTIELWRESGLQLTLSDFTKAPPPLHRRRRLISSFAIRHTSGITTFRRKRKSDYEA